MMLLYAVLLGNFGKYALAEIKYPAVVLMSNVSIKGSFFKRTDALMLAVWFFTLFSILNMTLFYGMELLERITQKRSKKAHIAVTIALTFAAAVIMEYGDGILKKYEDLMTLKTDLESILGIKPKEDLQVKHKGMLDLLKGKN